MLLACNIYHTTFFNTGIKNKAILISLKCDCTLSFPEKTVLSHLVTEYTICVNKAIFQMGNLKLTISHLQDIFQITKWHRKPGKHDSKVDKSQTPTFKKCSNEILEKVSFFLFYSWIFLCVSSACSFALYYNGANKNRRYEYNVETMIQSFPGTLNIYHACTSVLSSCL